MSPIDHSMPIFPVLYYLPEFPHIPHIPHIMPIVSMMPSNHLILSFYSPSALNLSQYQDISQWVSSLHQVAKWLELQLQHQSFQSVFRSISFLSKGLSRVFSSITIWKHHFFGAQPSLWANSHIRTWLLKKTQLWLWGPLLGKWCLCF